VLSTLPSQAPRNFSHEELHRNIDLTELKGLDNVIYVLDMFSNVEVSIFASAHSSNPKFFNAVKRYPNLRIKIFPSATRFPPLNTSNLPDSAWDGVVIREAKNINHICAFNPGMVTFPNEIMIVEASLAQDIFIANKTPVIAYSRLFSWTFPGLRKLQLKRECHLHDGDWSGYKLHLETFISRHPLLHTIAFTPQMDVIENRITGLPFPSLDDTLRQLAGIHSITIKDLVLVRDTVDNEWCIDSVSVVLKDPLSTTNNGSKQSVLDCLHKEIPNLRRVRIEIAWGMKHISTVSPAIPTSLLIALT
jgi:hypothetical protein